MRSPFENASVIDVFCGAGCLSHGFVAEGFSVECGIDVDELCRHAFEFNNDAEFLCRDVLDLNFSEVEARFIRNVPTILVGCAPCQPFSQYNVHNTDPKWVLVERFANLVENIQPDVVSMENVPRLVSFKRGKIFRSFLRTLRAAGYQIVWRILNAYDYGVPQTRRRLVLIGSRLGMPHLPNPIDESEVDRSVFSAIAHLPALQAGETDDNDPLHRARSLSPLNLSRIRASKPGGSWHDWDKELLPTCYQRNSGRRYTAVYGRMEWNKPAPTLTTQFVNYGSGRYGHPTQDRAISLREGAILQTIPLTYELAKDETTINFSAMTRLIGNAVPVSLARALASAIRDHLKELS
ncbi:MAG: DNA cytosine methyltransferase [Gammaproteobacteria bacterium]|nr:DNA cytosine methyltransferase [Gammaproteobacteria bacterium]MYF52703.1 DNA cytosine methyltransferase [Gammaproteobacteria bacterium]MYK43527.1 DNA cytosine methyltransferase [Gammaproteobacteria bacterium]